MNLTSPSAAAVVISTGMFGRESFAFPPKRDADEDDGGQNDGDDYCYLH